MDMVKLQAEKRALLDSIRKTENAQFDAATDHALKQRIIAGNVRKISLRLSVVNEQIQTENRRIHAVAKRKRFADGGSVLPADFELVG